MVLTYDEVKTRLNWGETNELEFKPEPVDDRSFIEDVFETIVGMSNTATGTLVLGVKEEKVNGRTSRRIVGMKKSAADISDKLTQMVNEFVEPNGLNFTVYTMESETDEPMLVGIDVKRSRGMQYAVRYDGLSSQKTTSYRFYLRMNGETRRVDFSTFLNHMRGNLSVEINGAGRVLEQQEVLNLRCQFANWRKDDPSVRGTLLIASISFENKAESYTIVDNATITIEYNGQVFSPIQSEPISYKIAAGSTLPNRTLKFIIPENIVAIKDTIRDAEITVKHTYGEKSIHIRDIKGIK